MVKNALVCIVLGFAIVGCSGGGSTPPPLNSDQEKQASDLDSIRKKANGNFDSLSAADKKTMINIAGSEQGARNMLVPHGPPGGAGGPRPGGQ